MAVKLGKGQFPSGHGPEDFICFGPPAFEDGKFEGTYLADLGCFNQENVDSNKYYHGAVVQSKKNNKFYSYFEWGRTGKSGDVQFTECSTKDEAQSVFAKQMHDKNDKRGEWVKIGSIKVLRAKAGKDCYLVRPQAKRTVGLPDAQRLVHDDAIIAKKSTVALDAKSPKKALASTKKWDSPTLQLLRDMNAGAVDYTRKNIEGGAIPTQRVIDEGRDILIAAQKRLLKVGRKLEDQISDPDLRQLSYTIYSRIGKAKKIGAPEAEWILSEQNIDRWNMDIDAFENALNAIEIGAEENEKEYDPFEGTDIQMIHIGNDTREGDFLSKWMPGATRNKHGHIGKMKIHNMWGIRQSYILPKFEKTVKKIADECVKPKERALFQPTRTDLSSSDQKLYDKANVALLFHGTRSINCPGILRTGLRLPKELVGVTIQGALYGPGCYHADDWKKSAQYCSLERAGYWSGGTGGVKGRAAFMFVHDVTLGNPFLVKSQQGFTRAPNGHHSVFAQGGYASVQNNEFIVYDTSQNSLRYLIEFSCS